MDAIGIWNQMLKAEPRLGVVDDLIDYHGIGPTWRNYEQIKRIGGRLIYSPWEHEALSRHIVDGLGL